MEAGKKGNAMEGLGEKKVNMGGKESRRIDSLGWITESSVMPKRQRAINGVGAASILALQAELYRTQEDIKKFKEGGGDGGGLGELDAQRSRKRLAVPGGDVFSRKNSGVDERAGRDKLHLKTENDGSASYTALEKKAELYDKLVRGEVEEGDDEKYNVLFYKKGTLEAEFQEMEAERRGETSPTTTASEYHDKAPLATTHISPGGGRGSSANSGNFVGLSHEQKVLIKEVNEETKQERQKASTLKEKRQEAAAKKREDLRNAYIKKKLEEMKAAAASRDASQPQLQSPGDTSSSPVVVAADGSTA